MQPIVDFNRLFFVFYQILLCIALSPTQDARRRDVPAIRLA